MHSITQALMDSGLTAQQASAIITLKNTLPAEQCWQKIIFEYPIVNQHFSLLNDLYQLIYPEWDKIPAPAWFPTTAGMTATNLARTLQQLNFADYAALREWSYTHYEDFWHFVCTTLPIKFMQPYTKIVDLTAGIEQPVWFPGATLNISESCFNTDKNKVAIIYQTETGESSQITYGELERLTNRVAVSLQQYCQPGAAIAIAMPMTPACVALYLGIIKAGCAAVSIADSFAPEEIATRLRIAKTDLIFTQDYITRNHKQLPLYEKVSAAQAPRAIVLTEDSVHPVKLRAGDLAWEQFLLEQDTFDAVPCSPMATINILFSSGTTSDPKAIPWNHTTAIKCASDAYFHQDVQPADKVAWPTNLGWMMGPWLIFASLINHATLALYGGTPNTRGFGEFVQDQRVTIVGLVPSIVKSWRASGCMEKLNWQSIKLFSSSGECSNVEDMLYLMALAGNKPVIEYCGGTEIGGGYITGSLLQPAAPAAFTTSTLGLHFSMLNEQGQETDNGEVAIIPPSIGLSTQLLNKDHHVVYFAGMPHHANGEMLRRHGDQIQYFSNGFYRALGRVDDTMNLGGIKISSAEIERTLLQSELISEAAAIAITPKGGGPSVLVIYAVAKSIERLAEKELQQKLQQDINIHLNPLFKIHQVIYIDALPRTASNKIIRRLLRDNYQETNTS